MTNKVKHYMDTRKDYMRDVYPAKDEKEADIIRMKRRKLLEDMTNDELDEVISQMGTVQAKIYVASFKKK